jgi:hypothetical protein
VRRGVNRGDGEVGTAGDARDGGDDVHAGRIDAAHVRLNLQRLAGREVARRRGEGAAVDGVEVVCDVGGGPFHLHFVEVARSGRGDFDGGDVVFAEQRARFDRGAAAAAGGGFDSAVFVFDLVRMERRLSRSSRREEEAAGDGSGSFA